MVILSEFQFAIQHNPRDQNVVADGLTRVPRSSLMEIRKHKRYLFVDDSILWKKPKFREKTKREGASSNKEDYDTYVNVEMNEVFSRYHNSIVGHLWVVMLGLECAKTSPNGLANVVFSKKIKYQCEPGFEDEATHHLHRLTPLTYLSLDAMGPLKQDENGSSYIIIVIIIVCNLSKLCVLYPAENTTLAEYIWALI